MRILAFVLLLLSTTVHAQWTQLSHTAYNNEVLVVAQRMHRYNVPLILAMQNNMNQWENGYIYTDDLSNPANFLPIPSRQCNDVRSEKPDACDPSVAAQLPDGAFFPFDWTPTWWGGFTWTSNLPPPFNFFAQSNPWTYFNGLAGYTNNRMWGMSPNDLEGRELVGDALARHTFAYRDNAASGASGPYFGQGADWQLIQDIAVVCESRMETELVLTWYASYVETPRWNCYQALFDAAFVVGFNSEINRIRSYGANHGFDVSWMNDASSYAAAIIGLGDNSPLEVKRRAVLAIMKCVNWQQEMLANGCTTAIGG
jgi:hypothetical protein